MEVKCEECGKSFDKPKGRISRTKTGKHYCSRECYSSNPIITQEKTGREFKCLFCGSRVYRSGAQIDRVKSGRFFCSKSCSSKYLSEQIQSVHNVVCDNCGTSFRKSPSTIGENNYCCRECWKDGIRSNGPPFYRKFKEDVCSICGFVPEDPCQLDVHHDNEDKSDNSKENLITLCANCHRLEHFKRRKVDGRKN